MNRGLVLALALAALLAAATARPDDAAYTTKFDNINLDEILGNERLRKNYLECLLGDTDVGCTLEGKELKKIIPDALSNGCSKCNDKQKAGVKKVIMTIRDNHPVAWEQLKAKWDPDNVFYEMHKDKFQN